MNRLSEYIQVYQSPFWQLNSCLVQHLGTSIAWDIAFTTPEIYGILDQVRDVHSIEKFHIYTHGDYDHIVAYPYLEGFVHLASEAMTERNDKQHSIDKLRRADHEFYFERPYEYAYPSIEKIVLKDCIQESVQLGSLEAIILKAGGHTGDGIFTVIPELSLWVAGDYLSDIEFPFIEDSIDEYFKTLDLADKILQDHQPEFMIPGHGSYSCSIRDTKHRIDQSRSYLDSLIKPDIKDWRASWGHSPFETILDKIHLENIHRVRS